MSSCRVRRACMYFVCFPLPRPRRGGLASRECRRVEWAVGRCSAARALRGLHGRLHGARYGQWQKQKLAGSWARPCPSGLGSRIMNNHTHPSASSQLFLLLLYHLFLRNAQAMQYISNLQFAIAIYALAMPGPARTKGQPEVLARLPPPPGPLPPTRPPNASPLPPHPLF